MGLRKLLWPFSLLYGAILHLRNLFFDLGWFSSKKFHKPVIVVGNLSTGGTGKTPMVEFILNHLSAKNFGVVSRGYGRSTRGLLVANENSSAQQIGDEPFQIHQKFNNVPLVVSEKRVLGVEEILKSSANIEAILLDDAYQHRYVSPSFQILLSSYQQPFFSDLILPAGNLREHSSGKNRANVIVITKCPKDLSIEEMKKLKNKIKPSSKQHVFFTTIEYGSPINCKGEKLPPKSKVLLVSGIAKPKTFEEYAQDNFNEVESLRYPDHHDYNPLEIKTLKGKLDAHEGASLLTTEKDWCRLMPKLDGSYQNAMFYIPISVHFLNAEGNAFINLLDEHIRDFKSAF